MRPGRAESVINGDMPIPKQNTHNAAPGIFTQSLSCQRVLSNGSLIDFEHAKSEIRQKIFEKALIETRESQQAI